jgi:hypothetical protein
MRVLDRMERSILAVRHLSFFIFALTDNLIFLRLFLFLFYSSPRMEGQVWIHVYGGRG